MNNDLVSLLNSTDLVLLTTFWSQCSWGIHRKAMRYIRNLYLVSVWNKKNTRQEAYFLSSSQVSERGQNTEFSKTHNFKRFSTLQCILWSNEYVHLIWFSLKHNWKMTIINNFVAQWIRRRVEDRKAPLRVKIIILYQYQY